MAATLRCASTLSVCFGAIDSRLCNQISTTGTSVLYKPGSLVGGKFKHDCGMARSVSWFLEGVLPLCPFAMAPISLTLTGITNDTHDQTVDLFRTGKAQDSNYRTVLLIELLLLTPVCL